MEKRQLIIEKALELFAKQGFEATSVQQITNYCGISKGAFYLSFKSKDELIIALIDHFMMEFIAQTDHIVRNSQDEKLLYDFYYAIHQSFEKHSDFAKVLIKEQSQTLNKEILKKMRYYDHLMENIILAMIDRLYGEEVLHIKYDLMFCIKGFLNTYSQLFLFYNVPLDLPLLSESLTEKTTLLARYMTVPFVSRELFEITGTMNEGITKEQILEMIGLKVEEMEPSLEKESLLLLKQEILEPAYSPAIIHGLLENIRNHTKCKGMAYVMGRYFSSLH